MKFHKLFSEIFVLLFIGSTFYSDYGTSVSDENTIIWTADYAGDVYSDRVSFGGENEGLLTGDEPVKIGYADGNGNYYISEFLLPATKTLIIEPGITITFTKYGNNFKIWGNLYAEGTEEKPIIFRSETGREESDPFKSWGDIDVYGSNSTVEPVLKYCHLYHGSIRSHRGLDIENSLVDNSYGIKADGNNKWKASIKDCQVSSYAELNGVFNGIVTNDCIEVQLIGNRLSGNASHIIAASDNIICEGNILSDNAGIFLGSYNGNNAIIRDNTLKDTALFVYGNFTVEDNYFSNLKGECALFVNTEYNPMINNNVIIGNVSLDGEAQERPLDLRYNYWGTVDSEKINSSIILPTSWFITYFTPEYEYEPYLDEDMTIYVYQPPNNNDDTDKSSIIGLIFIAVISIVSVIFLIIFIIFKRIKKKNS